ncbi:TonB family protein [Propionivibrio dicarboxylicus]|uniref:TonB protein C-terminal n=1 Tax=Propionivibrio dicarboxylicus TaxID=83767 RepID=A0A1G8HHJ5_9RHOO|nr:TonB family protein [Propionivibrio dicarboxylicus]SDI06126.1 TonB protein C-terminal [Propionivibrio dicarboxylicus]
MFQRLPRALVGALLLSLVAHLVLLIGMPRDSLFWLGRVPVDEVSGRFDARLQTAARTVTDGHARNGGGAAPRRHEAESPVPLIRSAATRRGESRRLVATVHAAPETMVSNTLSADRADGIDADDMRAYRFNLALAARQGLSAIAAEGDEHRQGRVDVSVTLRGSRVAAEVVVHRSSGQPALDRDAVRMMARAVALADLPRGMSGRDFRLVLPLLFGTVE